jgi:hypothetical protein
MAVAAAIACLATSQTAWAVVARSIQESDYDQFSQGELQSAALTSDGFLGPTYARRLLGTSGAEIVWDVAREASGKSVLCATGHSGKLTRIGDDGTTRVLATTTDTELTAVACLRAGGALIGGAPSGKIYYLGKGDRLTTATRLEHANYVWRMAEDAQGAVWAATGPEGRLYRLSPPGKKGGPWSAKLVAKLHSSNLLDLWIDETGKMGKPGHVYVAGQDPGWIYRVSPSGDRVEVVYNSQAGEARALAPVDGGLALALNADRGPTAAPMPALGGRPGEGAERPGQFEGGPQGAAPARSFGASRRPGGGGPRSEIVLLDDHGFARPIWGTAERPINSMAPAPDGVGLLVAAGDQGRLFEVKLDGAFSVVMDAREDYLTRVIGDAKGYWIGAARAGVVYLMERRHADQAVFLSQALDARLPVAWGKFYARGVLQSGQRLLVAFRTSNDGDLDSKYWSAWTKDQAAKLEEPVAIPGAPARFLQYRLKLEGKEADGQAPRIDAVEAFFQEPNAPPIIRKIEVAESSAPSHAPAPSRPTSGAPGESPARRGGGDGPIVDNARDPRSNAMSIKVTWQAVDPNGDELTYAVYFKAEDETTWKLIDDDLTQAQLPVDVGGVADGRYRFKVVADDKRSNPPGKGLTTEKISEVVTIDNTPPEIVSLTATVHGKRALVRARLADALSILASANVDIDNGDSLPMAANDGIVDQRQEDFEWETGDLKPGEHVVTVVATDRAGNSSVKKLVFTVDKGK